MAIYVLDFLLLSYVNDYNVPVTMVVYLKLRELTEWRFGMNRILFVSTPTFNQWYNLGKQFLKVWPADPWGILHTLSGELRGRNCFQNRKC